MPITCPGCGALSQNLYPDQVGYYTETRKDVRRWASDDANEEDAVYKAAILRADREVAKALGLGRIPDPAVTLPSAAPAPMPVCDRCHGLQYHGTAVPLHYPSLEAIADTIAESPHKNNHIYHVLDAADFPMSLIPRLRDQLSLSRQRSRNRRSRVKDHYIHGGLAEMDFIITRSDLLAPKKEAVDKMMPRLVEILREALGRDGRAIRLNNVRCVSAKRGWWTKEVKESIWKRGGGGWMVGKANVGKSNLFQEVFPKGRGGQDIDFDKLRQDAASPAEAQDEHSAHVDVKQKSLWGSEQQLTDTARQSPDDYLDVNSLLPPPSKEVPFPQMPLVSSLSGTTASPIRLPFGDGRGELIDLPGLARSNLDTYIRPEHRLDAVMTSRVKAHRLTLKPGQSLYLDGLIRITPTYPDEVVFMTHSFIPFAPHVTATEKALAVESGQRTHPLGGKAIADLGRIRANGGLKSAGKFQLKWDVTKAHAGPLVRRDDVGLNAERLAWQTFAADVLIEGCGWVEIVVELRKRKQYHSVQAPSTDSTAPQVSEYIAQFPEDDSASEPESAQAQIRFPEVEVFAPEGKFVGIRRPLNAWQVGGWETKPKKKGLAPRPRRSMKGSKARRRLSSSVQSSI